MAAYANLPLHDLSLKIAQTEIIKAKFALTKSRGYCFNSVNAFLLLKSTL